MVGYCPIRERTNTGGGIDGKIDYGFRISDESYINSNSSEDKDRSKV